MNGWVVPTKKHGLGVVIRSGSHCELWRRRRCDGALLVTVCDLFRIQGTLNQHGYHSILQQYTILFYEEGDWWSAASDDLASTITRPQPNWDGLGWVRLQSEGKAINKCSAYVGTPSRLLEKHSRWSWLRECQGCAKLSSRQRVASLKNPRIDLILFWLLHDSMYYFIVIISLLFYNVEIYNKEKPLNE